MIKSRFIALEGLHGVGKSTVARILERKYGLRRMPTVPQEFDDLRRLIDRGTSIDARFMFYMAAVLHAGEAIERALGDGTDVVVESYIHRTMAFHVGMGAHVRVSLLDGVFLPTRIFHLVCEDSVRKRRLAERVRPPKPWDRLAEDRASEVLAAYAEFPMRRLDTTASTAEEVAAAVMRNMLEEGGCHAD